MASAARNTLRPVGTRVPNAASTPMANAISVAIGTPHPEAPAPPALITPYTAAGTNIPPAAAATGSHAF